MDCIQKFSWTLFIFSLHFFSQSLPFVESNSSPNPTDKEALLSIKATITNDPSNTLASWNESSSLCEWSGVYCDRHHRVSQLDLQNLGLIGSLTPYIGNLTSLRYLYLQNNQLTGTIPAQIGNLNRLEVLNMSSNLIQGSIPSNIVNCVNLTTMDLSMNGLFGNIPTDIGKLFKLQVINLAQNKLNGPIPQSIGNISSLVMLNLATNTLNGTIPNELGNLHKLEQLQISLNNLTGTVPTSLYNISSLKTFAIASNDLYGEFPSDIGFKLPNLLVFHVCYNSFTGQIPPSLHNITKIQSIRMSHDYFVGSVPPGLDKLHDLTLYNIGFNQLVDNLEFISSLTNSTKLEFLAVDGNHFYGEIPNSIGNLSSTLSKLYIGGNQISGSIPKSIGQITSLTLLNMTDNLLSGEIPSEIDQLKNLQMLGLSMNRFSGQIPDSLGNLSRITQLEMYGNKLEGSIPVSFREFSNLLSLDLSNNNLEGNIPNILFTLTSLSSLLNLSYNSLTGTLPQEIGRLVNIVVIDISHNRLVGNITDSIGDCNSLQVLSMSSNSFIGKIPNTIVDLKALQTLDLSSNKLTGQIPQNLEQLRALQLLNLSFNDLEGKVPTDGVFRNQTTVHLEGNPNLCFSNSSCTSSHHKKLKVSMVVVIVLASLALCILLVPLSWVLFFRKKKIATKPLDITDVIKGKHRMISYDEISHATNNFDPANLIGAGSFGSVFKGLLRDGMTTAIKVLNLAIRGASKSFIAECEALRNVRHRNLVKLVTSCSSVDFANNDFQALVYEFMSNGSLDDWLKGRKRHENGKALSLSERLDIAIDVASAMDYLHNDCGGVIIHCDLKPSNVLLDDEMKAKVGDFGLAKLLVNKDGSIESFGTTNGLKGSIGYIPPEYGFGAKPSTRGDVYSYGVMLLELISGKSPTSLVGDLSLEKLVRAAFPDRVVELMDTDLLGTENVACEENQIDLEKQMGCLVSISQVGLSCATESPDARCSMRDALLELKNIKKTLLM